jgi:hypothetical protein
MSCSSHWRCTVVDHDVLLANTTLNLVRAPCTQQIAFASTERKTVMVSWPRCRATVAAIDT